MSSKKLRPLADFEWASAARYIVYVSCIAGLREINSSHVNSFSLTRLGPEKLLKQKERVLLLLEGNKASIERFVGEHMSELDDNELAVLRTLYLQYRDNVETVKGHIDFIGVCMVELELVLLKQEEGGPDGKLF
jgi:hypothetical protein